MALRLRNLLLAAAGGALAALWTGSLGAAADEINVDTVPAVLNRFVITDSGNRVLTGSVASDEVTQAGWYVSEDDRLFYYYSDGTCATEETTLDDGYTYVFAADGTLKTGWQMVDGKRYYYSAEAGTPEFGWLSYMDHLYYVDETAGKLTGVQTVDGVPYTFDNYGSVQTGWITYEDGSLYYYDADAQPANGWTELDGNTYYFTASGAAMGITTVDGILYDFDSSGRLQTGWITTDDGTLWANAQGELAIGLTQIDGKTYSFDANGIMQTGWVNTTSGTCYFDANGVMLTGLQLIDGSIYDLNKQTGAMEIGWQTINDAIYYFGTDGKMVTGWMDATQGKIYLSDKGMVYGLQKIDGKTYSFSTENGVMQTGWQTVNGNLFYFNETTGAAETGWKEANGKKLYLTESGAVTGLKEIDGKKYYFDLSSCTMQTGWITISGTSYYFDPTTGVMTQTGHQPVQLDAPDYKQFDSRWASKKIGYSTIKQVGCLTTAIAMKYSYETGVETTPDKMVSKLSYSGDNLLWVSYTNLGYTMESPSNKTLSQADMQKIYNCLQNGKPVIIGAKKPSGGQHYVLVTGYTGSTGSSFTISDFVINDPGSSTRKRLNEFFAVYTSLYRIIY